MSLPVSDVPVTIITGFLGVGKTTSIRRLLAMSPPDERWAVLVNEFGEVGFDGAQLSEDGFAIKEVAGGCICCSAGLEMRVAMVRLLREVRPDRLIIEPSGIAEPSAILDGLRTPGLRDAVSVRATICLVDPQRMNLLDEDGVAAAQAETADLLVANRCDLATPGQIAEFVERAGSMFPPKIEVALTEHGALDPAWINRAPTVERAGEFTDASSVSVGDLRADSSTESRVIPASGRWIRWPASTVFGRNDLEDVVHELARPSDGSLGCRLRGVFRTERRWLDVDVDGDEVRWRPSAHRSGSVAWILGEKPPLKIPAELARCVRRT